MSIKGKASHRSIRNKDSPRGVEEIKICFVEHNTKYSANNGTGPHMTREGDMIK